MWIKMEKESEILGKHGPGLLRWICSYWTSLRKMPDDQFVPNGYPGSLRALLPKDPPNYPDSFRDVLESLKTVVMPNVLHWMSPHFHAYFPSANSAASMLGDMVSAAINAIGFSWVSNPAGTELEVHVIDWLAHMLHLPDHFRFDSGKDGGGVIIGSASEATFLALLCARERFIKINSSMNPFAVMSKLIGYTSKEAHSSVCRAGLLARCTIRLVSLKDDYGMDAGRLREIIMQDFLDGYIPAFVCATLGTTGVCAFDDLEEIGQICAEWNIWLHVDAAYGGNAMICPEFRHLMNGVEHADSLVVSPHKWMMVNYDCSVLWIRSRKEFVNPFIVDPEYLKSPVKTDQSMPDFRHWQIPCGRRFRAMKLWFVIRMHGVSGLQETIRKQVVLGTQFAALVATESRLEVISSQMGVVGFRLRGRNALTEALLTQINATRKIRMVHSKIRGKLFVRFVASGSRSTADDVMYAWSIVQMVMRLIMEDTSCSISPKKDRQGNFLTRKCGQVKPNPGGSHADWPAWVNYGDSDS